MRRRIRTALLGVAVVAGCLTVAGPASAMNPTVCPSGCNFSSIQSAINAATNGQTLTIGAGTYRENVVVDRPLTLKGAGTGTVIEPATSNPICSPGSLCGGAASNIILVQADNVTITNLALEGDNPTLTSGVVVEGKDIDARNGIITNHLMGTFNNLVVSKVKVSDVYLRGIYASSGGTFNFNHNTVENVQGEEASIAMFNFEGSGSMEKNRVSKANDAISANWSKGTQFAKNTVTESGSGVHTDNNGGAGGVADVIDGNKISKCKENGYGIFVFVPYVSATVESNQITGCYVGIAAFGGAVSGQGPTFTKNKVSGVGATTSDPAGTYGAYITTDQLGFEFGDVTATLMSNKFLSSGTGLFVTQTKPTEGQPAGGQATVTASGNTIQKNTTGANGETGTVVEAQNNWWGCAAGPNTPKCDTAIGTVNFTPWLTSKP
jgi:nitrous oxidase accessory protein NosD